MIKDNEFIETPDVPGPTKEEIRCLVMCKAQIKSKDIVADIGCGTGGLTVEAALRAHKVYAVDKNPKAVQITRKNLKKQGLLGKVQVIEGDALEVLDNISSIDVLLVGGSSGDLPLIISLGYEKLNSGGRIVVPSILLETRVESVETLKKLKMEPEVIEVFIAKGKLIERGTMMQGRNPITIISAVK